MWFMAGAWVLLELTDSPAWVGLIGITAVPAIALSMFGGGLADRVPRATLILFGAAGFGTVFFLTALLVQFDLHNEWQILGLSLALGVFWAIQSPALKAILVELVDRSRLVTANALSELSEFSGEIAAPLVVGFLIAASGSVSVFWLASGLVVVELLFFVGLPRTATAAAANGQSLLSELRSGVRYMRRTPPFTALLVISTGGFFGSMLIPLVPVVARDVLDAGPSGFGVLSAALGAGLATGSVILILYGERGRKVAWLVAFAVISSAGIAGFAYADHLALAAVAVFAVGVGTAVTGNMVVTLFQVSASDEMRGRAMGVHSVASATVPLGALLGGWLGSAIGIEQALLVSAVATSVPVALAAVRSAELRRV